MSSPILLLAEPFEWAGEVSAAVSALLWASSGIVFARIEPPVSAAALNLCKCVTALLCFVGLLWILTGSPWPTGLDARATTVLAASGFLGLTLCDTFLLRSLLLIGPQRMSLVFLLVPVLTGLIAALPPFGERAPWTAWVGMATCLVGISLAVVRRHEGPVEQARFRRGVRNAALAALFQVSAVMLARYELSVEQAPVVDSAVVRLGAGTLGLILVGAAVGSLRRWRTELSAGRTVAMIVGAAFFGAFLGIFTNQLSLQWAAHTGVATTLNSLMPIYLLPLSAWFLGERFDRRGVLATVIAVGGIALMMTAR